MTRLLHIETSPRGDRSRSVRVGRAFLEAWRRCNPGASVDTLDLWHTELPRFDGAALDAKYALLERRDMSAGQSEAWRAVERVFARFAAADLYLFGVPKWNFGIPYPLKHFIDVVTQPGLAFRVVPGRGLEGLLKSRRAALVYASGAKHLPGHGHAPDFQSAYLEHWLGFVGIEVFGRVDVAPTIGPAETTAAAETEACRAAAALARGFARPAADSALVHSDNSMVT